MAPAYTILPAGSITNMCGVVLASYARPVALVESMRVAFCAPFLLFIHCAIWAPLLYSPLDWLVELIESHTTSFAPASFCAACIAWALYDPCTNGLAGFVHASTTNLPL